MTSTTDGALLDDWPEHPYAEVMPEHPVPARAMVLETGWLTVLSDLVLLELAERGAVERNVNVTSARTHLRNQSIEELEAIRDRLGAELVDRFEAMFGSPEQAGP